MKLDALGMGASIICAIHCAAVPFLLSLAATASLSFLQSPWFEFGILALAFVFVLLSLVPSYRKHKKALPLVLASVGLIAVVVNHILFGHEFYIISFIGAILITLAHYKNYRYSR
ncbi:MAG: MerC domain-containing protein [Bacteroidota bacterium]